MLESFMLGAARIAFSFTRLSLSDVSSSASTFRPRGLRLDLLTVLSVFSSSSRLSSSASSFARLLSASGRGLLISAGLSSSKSNREEEGLEDRQANQKVKCGWAGTAPFCSKSWSPSKCRKFFASAVVAEHWWVEKTHNKGDGNKCWSGKKAYCCHDAGDICAERYKGLDCTNC